MEVTSLYRMKDVYDNRGRSLFENLMTIEPPSVKNKIFNITNKALGSGDYSSMSDIKAIDLARIPRKSKKIKPVADITYAGGAISGVGAWLFSDKALNCMRNLLGGDIYLHECHVIQHDSAKMRIETGEIMWLAFVTLFAQGLLNNKKSKIDLIKEKYSIAINDNIAVPAMFKFKEYPRDETFVSQAFVDRYHECGLTGIEFELVTPELKSAWL